MHINDFKRINKSIITDIIALANKIRIGEDLELPGEAAGAGKEETNELELPWEIEGTNKKDPDEVANWQVNKFLSEVNKLNEKHSDTVRGLKINSDLGYFDIKDIISEVDRLNRESSVAGKQFKQAAPEDPRIMDYLFEFNQLSKKHLNVISYLNKSTHHDSQVKTFVHEATRLKKKYKGLVGDLRDISPRDYWDFREFMMAVYACLLYDVHNIIETEKIIIEKSNYDLKIGKIVTYENDDENTRLSFYIKLIEYYENKIDHFEQGNSTLHTIRNINDANQEKLKTVYRQKACQEALYFKLLMTGESINAYSINDFVHDLNYSGCDSFMDLNRLAFIYHHLIHGGLYKIGICRHQECNNLYYSNRIADRRGHFCTQKCYKNSPRRDKELERCQTRMRNFFSRKLDAASSHDKKQDFSSTSVSISTADCQECKYRNDPASAVKGDCFQLLRDPILSKAIEIVKQAKHKKKTKRKYSKP